MSDALALDFDRLLAAHGPRVRRVCRVVLRDRQLGEDAAQEAFFRLWRALLGGHSPEHPAAWLNAAAVNASVDLARRRDVQARAAERRAGAARPPAQTAPSDAAQSGELRERLERALAHLAPGQRTVFLLRHEGGLPLSAVAEALGVALPTVKTQFARACLRLQSLLQSFDPEART